jgi:hypothetical protein
VTIRTQEADPAMTTTMGEEIKTETETETETAMHTDRIVGKEMPISRIVVAVPNTTVVLLD